MAVRGNTGIKSAQNTSMKGKAEADLLRDEIGKLRAEFGERMQALENRVKDVERATNQDKRGSSYER